MDLGVRTWGNDMHGSTAMLTGTYQEQTEVGTRLLAVLPLSRAALARRFTDCVGEPPMTFLANRRIALAADLLRETDATILKRLRGISPQQHRLAAD